MSVEIIASDHYICRAFMQDKREIMIIANDPKLHGQTHDGRLWVTLKGRYVELLTPDEQKTFKVRTVMIGVAALVVAYISLYLTTPALKLLFMGTAISLSYWARSRVKHLDFHDEHLDTLHVLRDIHNCIVPAFKAIMGSTTERHIEPFKYRSPRDCAFVLKDLAMSTCNKKRCTTASVPFIDFASTYT